jgi:hypothetical protein
VAQPLDTHQRALAVNLDPGIFGTFAEIGAGQEVARWFLQVGGANATVAKTISAYDMTFSDAIYGKAGRYVSQERLVAMLAHEYALLVERLAAARGTDTRFFVFADTVAARNYAGTNECHGWMGLRFQAVPGGEPNDVLLHVNMMDATNHLQQEALGTLGVNLVYAAFHDREPPDQLLRSIFFGLSLDRLEIDVVVLTGEVFRDVDSRRLGVRLVREGLANVIVVADDGRLVAPSEFLRKRSIVVERRRLDAPSEARGDSLAAAARALASEQHGAAQPPLRLFEIPVVPSRDDETVPGDEIVLAWVDDVRALGLPVVLTRYPQWYPLARYFRRYSKEPMRWIIGIGSLVETFERASYEGLIGGLFEALGKVLAENVRMYVHAEPAARVRAALARAGLEPIALPVDADGFVDLKGMRLHPPLGHLLSYLFDAGWIASLGNPAVGEPRKIQV